MVLTYFTSNMIDFTSSYLGTNIHHLLLSLLVTSSLAGPRSSPFAAMEAPPTQRPIGLLELPAEIKNRIYRFSLTCPRLIGFNRFSPRRLLAPKLLQSCKAVCDEATAILYAENTFVITKPCDMEGLRCVAGDNLKMVNMIKNLTFQIHYGQGQDLINMSRVLELRKYRGLELIVIENQLSERPQKKNILKDRLRSHDNFESLVKLVTGRPEVRVICRAWYYGRVSPHESLLDERANDTIGHCKEGS